MDGCERSLKSRLSIVQGRGGVGHPRFVPTPETVLGSLLVVAANFYRRVETDLFAPRIFVGGGNGGVRALHFESTIPASLARDRCLN